MALKEGGRPVLPRKLDTAATESQRRDRERERERERERKREREREKETERERQREKCISALLVAVEPLSPLPSTIYGRGERACASWCKPNG